jgi:hypothetical protein
LPIDHPQIAELVPLQRHYEISRWSDVRSRWEFVGAGMINDYVASEVEIVYSGIDYKYILNQIVTPLPGLTLGQASSINPNISTVDINTVFNYPSGSTNADEVFGVSATFTTTTSGSMSLSVSAVSSTTKTVVISTVTATAKTPYLKVTYSASYTGSTSGFAATGAPPWRIRVDCSPPGNASLASMPLGESGKLGEFTIAADATTGSNRFKVTSKEVHLFPYATKQELLAKLISGGIDSATADAALLDGPISTPSSSTLVTSPLVCYPLRKGISYNLSIFGAIKNTASGAWWIINKGKYENTARKLGVVSNTVYSIVEDFFLKATLGLSSQRLRYASLSLDGSDGTTEHTVYTFGQPTLEFIGDVCDLEMGASTSAQKAIFRITKPSAGSEYSGNFKLSLGVSSAAIAGGALRYPENIKSYVFMPGYAKVANDVTIVSADDVGAVSGQSGAKVIAAQSSNTASIALIGRLPYLTVQGGFADSATPQKESDRLLSNRSVENTKQVTMKIITDGLEIWNGWDVGDSVNVQIKHGAVDISEPFVISGARWFGESDGHERIELDLVQGSAFATQFPKGFNILNYSGSGLSAAINGAFIT